MGNSNKREINNIGEDKSLMQLKNYKTMTLREYIHALNERGFDLSDWKFREMNDDEWKKYSREASARAALDDAQEHPISWLCSKKFRKEATQKHMDLINEAFIKEQLREYTKCDL
jgi:hypothetical protein